MRSVTFEKNGIPHGLLFFIPFLVIAVVTLFLKSFFSKSYNFIWSDFLENTLFSLILLLVAFCFKTDRIRRFVFVFLLLLFALSLFFEVSYFYFFGSHISQSAVFIFFESNFQESSAFLNAKLDHNILFFFLTFVILFSSFSLFVFRQKKGLPYVKLKYVVFLIFLILLFLRQGKLLPTNWFYTLAKAPFQYIVDSREFAKLSDSRAKEIFQDLLYSDKDINGTHIVVVGESTNRKHFSIYGAYNRNTTPLLNSIKEELTVYEDVITPHSFTIGTLTKSFTRSNYENLYTENNGSIVQLLNMAGYETFWLSNQKPLSVTEVRVTRIAKAADYVKFYNSRELTEKTPFDEEMFPELMSILQNKKKGKVIFLHLLGTHLQYDLRYPKKYSEFTRQQRSYDKNQNKIINAYDNAVLYNDFLIHSIIQMAKNFEVSSVLYFSDHGEDVYDSLDSYGHAVDTNDEVTSRHMYEIPFILWKSKNIENRGNMIFSPGRSYMIDDLFHSLADLFGIGAKEVDTSRSIFSKDFKERKRKIGRGVDYDLRFKN